MARQVNRLNARLVQTISQPGQYADGEGLYLQVTASGRHWSFIYRWQGKRREMGLGSSRDVTLGHARELAGEARATIKANADPIAQRDAARQIAEAPPPERPKSLIRKFIKHSSILRFGVRAYGLRR